MATDRDRFEVRRSTVEVEQESTVSYEAAEVVINGIPLLEIWEEAGGGGDAPLGAMEVLQLGRRIWLGEHPVDPELVFRDNVVVLACSCGSIGCGAVYVKIDVAEDTVTWRELSTLRLDGDPERPLGPFTFDRSQYEAAIEAVTIR